MRKQNERTWCKANQDEYGGVRRKDRTTSISSSYKIPCKQRCGSEAVSGNVRIPCKDIKGKLTVTVKRWGGRTRRISQKDFVSVMWEKTTYCIQRNIFPAESDGKADNNDSFWDNGNGIIVFSIFFLFLLNKLNRGNNDLLKKMDLFCTGRRDFFISPMAGI